MCFIEAVGLLRVCLERVGVTCGVLGWEVGACEGVLTGASGG